jgi:hypothetical protein
MLDAVREAAVRLVEPDPPRRSAYTGFYLDFLVDAGQQVGHEHAWYQQIAAEEANVRTALGWAEAEGDGRTLLELATGMWLFWQTRGGLAEGRHWLESGLAMQPDDLELRTTALWGLAWLAYHQADDDAAALAGEQLAQLADASGHALARRNALTITGMIAIARDRPDEAVSTLSEALQVARGLDRPWILATSSLNLALAHLAAGSPGDARPMLSEALQHYDRIGDLRFHARCIGYLGTAALLDGEPDRARSLFVQSFTSFRDLNEPAGIAEGLAGLAAVEAAVGDPTRAALLAGAAERIRDTIAARELPLERRIAGRYLGEVAERIEPEAWRQAWQRGRQLDADAISIEVSAAGGPL